MDFRYVYSKNHYPLDSRMGSHSTKYGLKLEFGMAKKPLMIQ